MAEDNPIQRKNRLPLGYTLDTYVYRHLLGNNALPFAKNARFEPGAIIKRPGKTVIYDFENIAPGTKILTIFPVNEYVALVFTGIKGAALGAQTGRVYEWNYVTDTADDNYSMIDITPVIYTGTFSDFKLNDTKKWHCCNHQDFTEGVERTICVNGWDRILSYVPEGGTASWTNPAKNVMTARGVMSRLIDMDIAYNLPLIPTYVASFYDCLYVANLVDDGYYSGMLSFSDGIEYSTGVAGIRVGDYILGQTSGAWARVAAVTLGGATIAGATITVGSGALVNGNNTITVSGSGDVTVTLATGYTGTATSGTSAVTSSPKSLVAGDNTVTLTGAGDFTVNVDAWAGDTAYGDLTLTYLAGISLYQKIGAFLTGEKISVVHTTLPTVDVEDVATISDGTTGDEFAVVWSEIGNPADFSVTEYWQRRPEKNLPINGMVNYTPPNTGEDWLIMSKGTTHDQNQLWRIIAHGNFSCINTTRGFSNQDGVVVTGAGELVYNDKGRILDISGKDLSANVALYMKSADPGNWNLRGVDKEYDDQIVYSTGRYMFIYDKKLNTWMFDVYDKAVEVFLALPAGRAAKQLVGIVGKHTQYSVLQEDIISDLIYSYDGSMLCVSNHYCEDEDANGEPQAIDFEVQTPTFPVAGDPAGKGRIISFELEGDADTEAAPHGPFTLSAFYSNVPRHPDWEEVGDIALDGDGHGEIWLPIDKRCVWLALKINSNDTQKARLFNVVTTFVQTTMR
jgi:hypothetical protein